MIFPVLLVKVVQTKPQTIKQISLCTDNMLDQQYYHDRKRYCRCKFFMMAIPFFLSARKIDLEGSNGKAPDEGNKENGKEREHLKTL